MTCHESKEGIMSLGLIKLDPMAETLMKFGYVEHKHTKVRDETLALGTMSFVYVETCSCGYVKPDFIYPGGRAKGKWGPEP
jgi:hypothetical protein